MQRQLRQKEKECDELKDQCLALRLDKDGLRYIMLCHQEIPKKGTVVPVVLV